MAKKQVERIEIHCPHCKGTIMRKVTEPPVKKCPWCKQEFPVKPPNCEWPECGGKLPRCGTTEECKLHIGEKTKKSLTPGKKEIQKVRAM